MSHTGIRLRVVLAGAGTILEGDSDWLHMTAALAEYLKADAEGRGFEVFSERIEGEWYQVMGGPVEIWVQPVMLPDEYPDDQDSPGDAAPR